MTSISLIQKIYMEKHKTLLYMHDIFIIITQCNYYNSFYIS